MMRGLPQSLWVLALMLVAALATGAQLDRQSRYRPELVPLVPEPFRAFGQYHVAAAAAAAASARPGAALNEARQLLARRPIPAEHLSLLALAQLRAGQGEAGRATLQLAAQRGWRDPAAQKARLRAALAAGDGQEAALRLAAIWALARDDAELAELAPLVLENAAARHAMAELLAHQPRWAKAVWQRGPRILDRAIMDDLRIRTAAVRGP